MSPFADHFSRVAPAYASCRPRYPDGLFAYLAGLPPDHDLAWDCGAGNGQASLPLAQTFSRVVATDLSAMMLDNAPSHPRIEYRVAVAEDSGLATRTVDLVTVAQALHWFEIGLFYQEVDRVLKPGGVLAVWCYGNQRIGHQAVDRVLDQFYHHVVGPFWPAERRLVEAGYRTLPFPYPELAPPDFALEERWSLPELLGYIGTWSATQRYRERTGDDPVPELGRRLANHWCSTTRLVRWPLSIRVGRRPLT
jgi:SAM-dependent methyltransferase